MWKMIKTYKHSTANNKRWFKTSKKFYLCLLFKYKLHITMLMSKITTYNSKHFRLFSRWGKDIDYHIVREITQWL